jgi:hypothetical protein
MDSATKMARLIRLLAFTINSDMLVQNWTAASDPGGALLQRRGLDHAERQNATDSVGRRSFVAAHCGA